MKIRCYYVYILSNKNDNVIYVGVTNNLSRRVLEHKQKRSKGFTERYNVDKLIYFETFEFIRPAIAREKQLKGYSRIKKEKLINAFNPQWTELYDNGNIKFPE
jgi:putative endonuclease